MSTIVERETTAEPKVSEDTSKVLVVFTQDSCGKCPGFLDLAKEAAPKDVKISEIKIGGNEGILALARALQVMGTPTAFYLEGGQVKKRIVPTGVKEKDEAVIRDVQKPSVMSKTLSEGDGICEGVVDVSKKDWQVGLKPGSDCEETLLKARDSLGPAAKSYLSKHLSSDDPELRTLIRGLKEK